MGLGKSIKKHCHKVSHGVSKIGHSVSKVGHKAKQCVKNIAKTAIFSTLGTINALSNNLITRNLYSGSIMQWINNGSIYNNNIQIRDNLQNLIIQQYYDKVQNPYINFDYA